MKFYRSALAMFVVFVAVSVSWLAVDARVASADTSAALSSWVDGAPVINNLNDLTSEEFQVATSSPLCTPRVVREWGYSSGFGPKQDYQHQGCLVDMASGQYDSSSQGIVMNNSDRLQRLKDPLGDALSQIVVTPAPNTNRLAMVYDSYYPYSNGGAKLKLVDNWMTTFPPTLTIDGYSNVERIRTTDYDYELKDSTGSYVRVSTQGLVYSSNGDWLQVLLPGKAHAVLDVNTHEIVPYADANESGSVVRSAVSNDGRYVARTHQQDSLKIYDLSRCEVPAGEFVSRNCRAIELQERIKNFVDPAEQIFIGNVEFVGAGDALDVDVRSSIDGTNWQYATYRLSIPGRASTKYLALGDSFSSGEGAYDYIESTDMFASNEEYNVCHISRKSYPYLLQDNLRADWFHSVACSGAESEDIVYGGSDIDFVNNKKSQSKISLPTSEKVVAGYRSSLLPGYVPQNTFATKHNPNIATISIGGNDVGFAGMLTDCAVNFSVFYRCYSDRTDREYKANEIDQKIAEWSNIFVDIKNSQGGKNPKLYVIGYPKIINPHGLCGYNVRFEFGEAETADKLIDYLNTAVKVAADAAGVRYVDVSDAFTRNGDYRLCNLRTDFAVNGLNMWSIINECASARAPDAQVCPDSFHPNAFGQKLLAETISLRTAGLTQEMPNNSNSMAELIDKRMNFVGDVAITLQNHRVTFQKDIAPALITKGESIDINLPLSTNDLPAKPGTTATVTLHSTPRVLGQLPIATDGTVSGEMTLPADIETGYHRLIISYTDMADNVVEKYTYFYAAQSGDDWDGDGVPNASDPCASVAQAGVDQDEDGIDDACDGEYVKSAQTVQPTSPAKDDGEDQRASLAVIGSGKTQPSSTLDNPETVSDLGDIFGSPGVIVPLTVTKQAGDLASTRQDSETVRGGHGGSLVWLGALITAALVAIVFVAVRQTKRVES